MNTPKTARRGVCAGVAAMLIAVAVTWAQPDIIHHWWIVGAIVAGFVVGVPLVARAAHGGAAADRAVARLRRPGRGPGRHGRVLPVVSTKARTT